MSKILPDLSKMNADQLRALVAAMAANAPAERGVTLKVSAKGALSIYGLGRWPVTLYRSQFDKLNAAWPQVQAFVEANAASFSTKED